MYPNRSVHTDVRVCPSAHTGRPWPSVSTHRTSGCPSVHISARSVDCSGDFGPRGLSVQYTQDVRQHTQDVRGCPCVSVCPSVHTGRPSAHAGRPSAHAGRPWLSVCLRVSVSAHRTSVSTHRTSVSTRRTSVSTRRTSVAVRVCPCVRQCTQDVRQHTQDVRQHTQDVRGCPCVSVCPSAHAGRPSAHAGRPMLTTHISMLALPVDCPCTDAPCQYTYQHAGPSRGLIRVLIRVLNSYQHADHTYQHAGPSRGLSVY
ncbi:hypothetical protein YC2023_003983 [Brassica napus]